MADLYQKALEANRKALWATCRLKGLARDTPERQRLQEPRPVRLGVRRLAADTYGRNIPGMTAVGTE